MRKVVIHIDEEEKWSTVLGNIRNLKKEQVYFEIEVVVNGSAIKGYLNPEIAETVEAFVQQNILFVACNNSMQGHSIKREQLNSAVTIVSSGILEIIEQQHAGAAYVKP
ncbi:DsrE family protein [Carnobacterium funditum]|uniref:DsrE family protein n=1 Tax=Carnobacterium funditum TaxID=2752 RepID=UPI0005550D62|nr:DsrE family protein [Carnobacterium funditum]